jgi:hypothetical protein
VTTKLDPQTRPTLRSQLMNLLYQAEQFRSFEELCDIVNCQQSVTNIDMPAFTYLGKIHAPQLYVKPKMAPQLHDSLHARMDSWLQNEMTVLKEEMVIVSGYITAVLNTSNSPDDWMRLLPPAVHAPLQQYKSQSFDHLVPPVLTNDQVNAFLTKQERFLNMLKGRMALNLLMA